MKDFVKNTFRDIKYLVTNPIALRFSLMKRTHWLWSDALYVKQLYRAMTGRRLNLKHPLTYSEKLNWLKVYYHNPAMKELVDKYRCKDFVARTIGKQYVVPVYGVWDKAEDIDFDSLPDAFCLKINNGSGREYYHICRDKSKLDRKAVREKMRRALSLNYYREFMEWPYKGLKSRVFAEALLNEGDNAALTDYKFFCFDGVPKLMYISKDAADVATTDFFDMDYNLLKMRLKDPNSAVPPQKPECFDEMKRFAGILSQGFPHVRVDFYYVDGQIYVGEMTFFHFAGFVDPQPAEWGRKMGDYITLPEKML